MSDQNKKILHESAAHDDTEENCCSEALLLQFLEGGTSAEETRKVQAHLNECERCAYIVSAVYDYQAHPITEEELREAQKLVTRTPEEQAAKLLKLSDERIKVFYEEPAQSPSWRERLRAYFAASDFARPRVWGPAFAVLLVLLTLGGRWGRHYAQVDSKLAQAEQILRQEHRPFYKDVRLSGGFVSSGIGGTMAAADNVIDESDYKPYLQAALAQVRQALAHDAESLKARRLLAQILIIAEDHTRADSLVAALAPFAEKSPALANDLGVYYFKRKDWSSAEKYLALAQAGDSKLGEAYFNLALVKAKLGKKSEASALLEKYLPLETDENWKRAAFVLKQDLHAE